MCKNTRNVSSAFHLSLQVLRSEKSMYRLLASVVRNLSFAVSVSYHISHEESLNVDSSSPYIFIRFDLVTGPWDDAGCF